jgi:hypothetical protein
LTSKNKLAICIFGFIISILLVFLSIKRDLIYKQDYNSDLRNRVVGARLIQDGKLPYFYKWKKEDGLRYYDPSSFGDGSISTITASPFFLRTMIPLVNFPQSKIATFWLIIQYLLLVSIIIAGVYLSNDFRVKVLVVAVGLAFLFTDAWKYHVLLGQSYIVIPFLLALFTLAFLKGKSSYTNIFCGCIAAVLIFTRPNFIVFFIPFLFFIKQVGFRKVILISLPVLVGLIFILLSSFERNLWMDYLNAVKEHTRVHQGEKYTIVHSEPDPKFTEWEGLDMRTSGFLKPEMTLTPKTENGNFFVIYNIITNKKLGTRILAIMCVSLIVFSSFLFLWLQKKTGFILSPAVLIIFGFCLYMLTDIFSPIYRHQYYTIQWIFPILLFFSTAAITKKYLWLVIVVLIGIFLNILRIPMVKMEHTIGEYLIFAALFIFCFVQIKKPAVEK